MPLLPQLAGGAVEPAVAALRATGVPSSARSARASACALFSVVLRALPASARTWFGDLRDRGAAAAAEAYTSAVGQSTNKDTMVHIRCRGQCHGMAAAANVTGLENLRAAPAPGQPRA